MQATAGLFGESSHRLQGRLLQMSLDVCYCCIANAMQVEPAMKTATLPPLRVEPELRKAAEAALHEGESLSSLMEQSLRDEVNRRRLQAEFIARGLAARDEARRTGVYYSVDEVMGSLRQMLSDAKAKKHS